MNDLILWEFRSTKGCSVVSYNKPLSFCPCQLFLLFSPIPTSMGTVLRSSWIDTTNVLGCVVQWNGYHMLCWLVPHTPTSTNPFVKDGAGWQDKTLPSPIHHNHFFFLPSVRSYSLCPPPLRYLTRFIPAWYCSYLRY